MMKQVKRVSDRLGLRMNIEKIKLMSLTEQNLEIGGEIERSGRKEIRRRPKSFQSK